MKRKSLKKKKIIITILICIALVFIPSIIYSNHHIDVENISFKSRDIPKAFDGVKIAHLSDYHNHGEKFDKRLVNILKKSEPDYIFITGDIADKVFTDIDKANHFLKEMSCIAPCYLVWGNHDKNIDDQEFEKMNSYAQDCGITVLNNDVVRLCKEDEYISVTGNYDYIENASECGKDEFNIWLNHFPENFETIADGTKNSGNQMDLMFSGHAHGGLIRFPGIKGLFAPGQGFFPEYTSGVYEYNGSSMIVSRGIGNSTTTLRLFDTFHVIICTLESGNTMN